VKMFDAGKTRMIGLPYGEENYDNMLIQYQRVTDRRTDARTDRIAISISRVSISVLTRDKNCTKIYFASESSLSEVIEVYVPPAST